MRCRNVIATVICWFLALVLLVVTPSCSLPTTQRSKAANKALEKFSRWKQQTEENSRLLWVDGNNVRGIGKFEWNAVELQHRVVRFCHKHKIENAIVVWDHGSIEFASSASHFFDSESNSTSGSQMDDLNDSAFCVNLVTLFSGLRQRADDVLVKESNHLVTTFDGTTNPSKLDWGSLAFVTNDRDLNYKLRNQVTPNPPSLRLSRRKRGGNLYNASEKADSSASSLRIKKDPLFCDSTGFVELLCDLSREYTMELSPTETKYAESIETAKASIRHCSKSQRRGYNPRREKTWERCVQAETLRRHLANESSFDQTSTFVADYLEELRNERGYSGTTKSSEGDIGEKDYLPFLGPTRLDKHQRRMLDRYNALAKKGELP